jgi:hypothetical protein
MFKPGIVQTLFGRQTVSLRAQNFHVSTSWRLGSIIAAGRTSEIPR